MSKGIQQREDVFTYQHERIRHSLVPGHPGRAESLSHQMTVLVTLHQRNEDALVPDQMASAQFQLLLALEHRQVF